MILNKASITLTPTLPFTCAKCRASGVAHVTACGSGESTGHGNGAAAEQEAVADAEARGRDLFALALCPQCGHRNGLVSFVMRRLGIAAAIAGAGIGLTVAPFMLRPAGDITWFIAGVFLAPFSFGIGTFIAVKSLGRLKLIREAKEHVRFDVAAT